MLTELLMSAAMALTSPEPVKLDSQIEQVIVKETLIGKAKSKVRIGKAKSKVRIGKAKSKVRIGKAKSKVRI